MIRTLRHEPVDRAPRDLWALPGADWDQGDEIREVLARFPTDFAGPHVHYGAPRLSRGQSAEVGHYTDEWGSVWYVGERGVVGEVKEPRLADWSAFADFRPPLELLDEADFSQVNRSCAETDRFVKAGTHTRPFERAQFLRGTENLFMDLAYDVPEVHRLLAILHDFFCREMRLWAATDVDGVSFMDDWGAQNALLIHPEMWRRVFKPMYRDYCSILHERGKFVFFHSDGHIEAIYPDLIEIGVDAVNSQLFCMDIEKLGHEYSGKVTFWGEIDRQHILPFGTPDDVRSAVRRVRAAMDHGRGGLIAEAEWGLRVPKANIVAMFDEWEKPL